MNRKKVCRRELLSRRIYTWVQSEVAGKTFASATSLRLAMSDANKSMLRQSAHDLAVLCITSTGKVWGEGKKSDDIWNCLFPKPVVILVVSGTTER